MPTLREHWDWEKWSLSWMVLNLEPDTVTTGQKNSFKHKERMIFSARFTTICDYPVATSRSYILSTCSLKMSSSSNVMHVVEDVPLSNVPQRVLQLETVEKQVAEMQEFFRAFARQDHTIRDYRPYFKPILCYMEGAWVYPDLVELDESPSSRHSIDSNFFMYVFRQLSATKELFFIRLKT